MGFLVFDVAYWILFICLETDRLRMDDFESIPLPPSDSAMEIEPGTDDVRKYWERAQASLQSISGASVQHPLLPFQPPMSPYYPSFAVNQFVQNYDPPMFNQMPSMYQPDSMDARRLEAERRLRDVMPKGAVIYGLGFSNPGSRGRGGGNQRGGINRGGMQQQSNRPPRPAYNRVPGNNNFKFLASSFSLSSSRHHCFRKGWQFCLFGFFQ